MKYSVFSLAYEALLGHGGWQPAWRDAAPKANYDVIIVGGGGHGLATAFYLAKEHGLTNVAVLEKGWIGSGNAGRNTTIIRSNYLLPQNIRFYEWSMKLWEGLERELNYNTMVSQRGVVNLYHSDAQRDAFARRGNAMRLNGVDAELLDRAQVRAMLPFLDYDNARFPIHGGAAAAPRWHCAPRCRRMGLCAGCRPARRRHHPKLRSDGTNDPQRTHYRRRDDARKHSRAKSRACGRRKHVAADQQWRDCALPIEAHVIQAFVTEGIKPAIDCVMTFGAGHFYISQSDKGGLVFGGDVDGYNTYAQRGNLPTVEDIIEGGVALWPGLGRLRVLRHWGGLLDMSMDGSPIIDRTPIDGLYLNAGWNYGGFKATPASGWCFAHTIARGEPHALNSAFRLDRFAAGNVIDEKGVGAQPNLH